MIDDAAQVILAGPDRNAALKLNAVALGTALEWLDKVKDDVFEFPLELRKLKESARRLASFATLAAGSAK